MVAVVGLSKYLFPGPRTGLTGHNGDPHHAEKEVDKGQRKGQRKAKGKGNILGRAWAPLLSALALPPVLRGIHALVGEAL